MSWVKRSAKHAWRRSRKIAVRAYHATRKTVHRLAPLAESIASRFGEKGAAVAGGIQAADSALQGLKKKSGRDALLAHAKALAMDKASPYLQKGQDMAKRVLGTKAADIARTIGASKEGRNIVDKAAAQHPNVMAALHKVQSHITSVSRQAASDTNVQHTKSQLLLNMFQHGDPVVAKHAAVKKAMNAHNPVTVTLGKGGAGERQQPLTSTPNKIPMNKAINNNFYGRKV